MTRPIRTTSTLLDRIRSTSQEVGAGAALPPEPILARELGVSRSQLREQMARLESSGLIARRARAGTVANREALDIQTWLTHQETFTETLARLNIGEPEVDLLSLQFREMTESERAYFRQPAGCGLIDGRKRFRVGSTVHMSARYQIPAPGVRSLSDIDDPGGQVFDVAARLVGSRARWEVARSSAALPDEQIAGDLEISVGSPVFVLDLMGVGAPGDRLYRIVEHHAGGAVGYGFVRTFD